MNSTRQQGGVRTYVTLGILLDSLSGDVVVAIVPAVSAS